MSVVPPKLQPRPVGTPPPPAPTVGGAEGSLWTREKIIAYLKANGTFESDQATFTDEEEELIGTWLAAPPTEAEVGEAGLVPKGKTLAPNIFSQVWSQKITNLAAQYPNRIDAIDNLREKFETMARRISEKGTEADLIAYAEQVLSTSAIGAEHERLRDIQRRAEAVASGKEFEDAWRENVEAPLIASVGGTTGIAGEILSDLRAKALLEKAKWLALYWQVEEREPLRSGFAGEFIRDNAEDILGAVHDAVSFELLAKAEQGRLARIDTIQQAYDLDLETNGEESFDLALALAAAAASPTLTPSNIISTLRKQWKATHRSKADLDDITAIWEFSIGTGSEFDLTASLDAARLNPAATVSQVVSGQRAIAKQQRIEAEAALDKQQVM